MRLVICHACWRWIYHLGTQCPHCHSEVHLHEPDPVPAQMARIFGEFVARLAVAQVEKATLPSVGSVLGTTEGLLFIPFLQTRDDGSLTAARREGLRRSNWWTWLLRKEIPPSPQWGQPQGTSSRADAEEIDLASLFLNAPGAWFIDRRSLRRQAIQGQHWTVTRSLGATVTLQVLSSPEEWRSAWRQLVAAGHDWGSLVPASFSN